MTERELLDHFAGLAMQSMINTKDGEEWLERDDFRSIAIGAYAMAKAMIDYKIDLVSEGLI